MARKRRAGETYATDLPRIRDWITTETLPAQRQWMLDHPDVVARHIELRAGLAGVRNLLTRESMIEARLPGPPGA